MRLVSLDNSFMRVLPSMCCPPEESRPCHGSPSSRQIAASVTQPDGGAYGVTFGQQLGDYGTTGSSGCAGDQNFWVNHGRHFN
jgi:hypothetical protein